MKPTIFLTLASRALNKASDSNSPWVGSTGNAPVEATQDPFYDFDRDNITQYALGDILNVREVGLEHFNYSKAWQVLYRSENTFGSPTASVTTIVLPLNMNSTDMPAKVVSYQEHEDSSFENCSPSYLLLSENTDSNLQGILDKGYVLNFPDHEGKNSSFTAGALEGKLTLDSLRALKNAQNLTGVETGQAILWGYSGGSIATGWASEFYDWYAPELDIAAMAVGGFVVNLTATVELVNGTPYVGFVPPGFLGIAAEYPDVGELFSEQLKPSYAAKTNDSLQQCVLEDLGEYANLNIFDFFKDGSAILNDPALAAAMVNTTMGTHAPKAPLLVYNGIEDQIAPISNVDDTVSKYCNDGAKVRYIRVDGKDHVGTSAAWDAKVLDSFADIFAGKLWDKCEVEGLPIGQFGNNTVPQPKSLGNSTNSTTAANSTSSSQAPRSTGTAIGTSAATSAAGGSPTSAPSANSAPQVMLSGIWGILAMCLTIL